MLQSNSGRPISANKAYVDSVASGLDVKDSVRVASTGDVNTATPPNGNRWCNAFFWRQNPF